MRLSIKTLVKDGETITLRDITSFLCTYKRGFNVKSSLISDWRVKNFITNFWLFLP